MEICKYILAVVRISLLLAGFSFVCLGAFYVSTSYGCDCKTGKALAYSLLPSGFLFLLTGIFWSTYHEANQKSIFHNIIRQIPRSREMHINTIDRPDFYPPSYEESMNQENLHNSGPSIQAIREEEAYNIPPPLYTESSLEIVDENEAHEDLPPSYEASVQHFSTSATSNSSCLSRPSETFILEV
ncbi:transmembrane protein 252 [Microcaecilia unicolor]|uniref:Transmembrane protein 252 n=1 Tax=Microcaecilia unicolor TaxID=1415580 RepID=A0A6P7X727_9AMPH|nr:transmembrane protein 252 [Microcaecilia unicolor]